MQPSSDRYQLAISSAISCSSDWSGIVSGSGLPHADFRWHRSGFSSISAGPKF